MHNNKGQSLVMFVLILPIILMILVIVVDIGKMILLRSSLNNINYIAMDYGLDNLDRENIVDDIEEVIYKNKSDIDSVSVLIDDGKIQIALKDNVDLLILKDRQLFYVKSTYVGYISNNKKIIERVK